MCRGHKGSVPYARVASLGMSSTLSFIAQHYSKSRMRHQDLFGEPAKTMIHVQLMWQGDMRAVASSIKGCLDVYHDAKSN